MSGYYLKAEMVRIGCRSMSDDGNEMKGKRRFMLVVGGNAVGAWVLLDIAIMGCVGIKAIG